MSYFVTGATGFIGRNLVERLLQREGTIYALVRAGSRGRLEELRTGWGADGARVVPISGDLTQPGLAISEEDLLAMRGEVDHFFHLAAIYDITADAETQEIANVEGTRHAIELAGALDAGCFHHVSSIAAAGLYKGVWTEDMFDEAERLDTNPYFRTKHEAERLVREDCPRAVAGVPAGDRRRRLAHRGDRQDRRALLLLQVAAAGAQSAALVAADGRRRRRRDQHRPGRLRRRRDRLPRPRGRTSTGAPSTSPTRTRGGPGEVVNVFAKAADAPRMAVAARHRRDRARDRGAAPALRLVPGSKRAVSAVLSELGLPASVLTYVDYPTRFDSRRRRRRWPGAASRCRALESYATRVWDYWERNLDPDLFKDRSLAGAVRGKVVLITGASSGIGRATAVKVADAGATVLLVARSVDKLEETKDEIIAAGGVAHIHRCDLADVDDVARMADEVLTYHGHVDILVNNAGRSIRRSVALSYDRFHDYERTIQLNYLGALRLILALLPTMRARKSGHIINISSIGTQTNPPRFSAYVASKAALDAFSRVIASEVIDDKVHITTINMPLVRTPMIAPTRMYDMFPAITPEEAAEMIAKAMVRRPKKVATKLGNFGELLYAVAPKASDSILNTAYKLFPDSQAAKGKDGEERPDKAPSTEAVAFAHLMKGVHW